jgi:pyroglutamyl-peptidase
MKILLTGFVPFGKFKINPSEEVVRCLRETKIPGVELVTTILAVHPKDAAEKLLKVFEESKPEAVLMLGESGGHMAPTIERVFVNILEYPAEFGNGIAVSDQAIDPEGPTAFLATLPIWDIQDRLLKAGLPVRLSLSAGTYICNQVGYVILSAIHRRNLKVPCGLFHLPFLPSQAASLASVGAYPSVSLETHCQVISLALETIAQKRVPSL